MESLVMNYSDEDDEPIFISEQNDGFNQDKCTAPTREVELLQDNSQISGRPEKILGVFGNFPTVTPIGFEDSICGFEEGTILILSDEDGSDSDAANDVISSIVISRVETVTDEQPDFELSSSSAITVYQAAVDERPDDVKTETGSDKGEERCDSSLSNKENSTENGDKPVKSKGEECCISTKPNSETSNQDTKTDAQEAHRKESERILFKCKHCSYSSTIRFALKRHLLSHSAIKPKSVFNRRNGKKLNVSEKKLFSCDYCSYETYAIHSLFTHNILHTKYNRPIYQCPKCDFKSTRKNYSIHLIKAHKQNSTKGSKSKASVHRISKHKKVKTDNAVTNSRAVRKGVYRNQKPVLEKTLRKTLINIKKRYSCTYCSYSTDRKACLTRHTLGHTENETEIVSCNYCNFKSFRRNVISHSVEVHGRKFFKTKSNCSLPSKPSRTTKADHDTKWKPTVNNKCEFCSFATEFPHNLLRHRLLHTVFNTPILSCSECSYKAPRMTLRAHYKQVHGQTAKIAIKHKCNLCSYTGRFEQNLKKHCLLHTVYNRPIFSCSECSYKAPKITLRWHYRKIHGKTAKKVTRIGESGQQEVEYRCGLCSYTSKVETNLKKHRRLHTVYNRPIFSCSECSYKAPRATLGCHYRKIHGKTAKTKTKHDVLRETVQEEAKHSCNPRFHYRKAHGQTAKRATRQSKTRHYDERETVRQDGKHSCDFCSFTCRFEHSLRSHVRLHTVYNRPIFSCSECSYKAPRITLIRHYNMNHRQTNVQSKTRHDEIGETVQHEAGHNCNVCSYTSKSEQNLRHHQLHTVCNRSHYRKTHGQTARRATGHDEFRETEHKEAEHLQMIHKANPYLSGYNSIVSKVTEPSVSKEDPNRANSPELVQIIQTLYNRNNCNQDTMNNVVYMCEFCGYSTQDKLTLINHKSIHSQTNDVEVKREQVIKSSSNDDFNCTECGRYFFTRQGFTLHTCEFDTEQYTVKVTGESLMFKCRNCTYRTKRKMDMKKHCDNSHF